jgi:pimeloyl-ACP methyl ester carboxylesterase
VGRWIALAIFALLVALVASRTRADIPLAELRTRWAGGASRFVEIDGMPVHYRDEGTGPAVVLLHGTSSSLHTWDGWAADLSRDHRVVRFDLPAFGLTGPSPTRDYSIDAYVRFVEHVTARLGVPTFVLGGNSLGGGIAWHYAVAHPAQVRALILVDSIGYSPPAGTVLAFRIAHWPLLPRLLVHLDPSFLVDNAVRKVYGDPASIQPGVRDRYLQLSLRPGNRQAFLDRMRTPSPNDSALIATIRAPTLIVWGGRDRLVPVEDARRFMHDIPGANAMVYAYLGHVPMEEDPETTVRDVRAFLAEVQ